VRRIALIYRALALILVVSFAAVSVAAQGTGDWVALSAEGIKSTLTGAVLDYPNAWQDFRASGKTLYNAGQDSWGNWRVDANQYCSQWPPRDLWDCYDVARNGGEIRFTGAQGDETIGTMRK
jgi:hypothetical protein